MGGGVVSGGGGNMVQFNIYCMPLSAVKVAITMYDRSNAVSSSVLPQQVKLQNSGG
jgi:hypothetical protein